MILDIFITFSLVFLNGFFVAAEFAIVKVRHSQIELKVQTGHRSAKLSKHITHHLNRYLAATQVGVTIASLGLGWIGEPVVSKIILNTMNLVGIAIAPEMAHSIALPLAFIIITILHIVFGELAPKSIAISRSEKTTLFIAYPLQLFYFVFRPFIWILNGFANRILKLIGISSIDGVEYHSSEEFKYIVKQGKESGVIEEADYTIIKNAFEFSERTAKQIMVPRTQVVAIDINDFTDESLDKVLEEGFSRIPCYENSFDNVLGVVYTKDLLFRIRKGEQINIRNVMRPVPIVPESKYIGQLLKEFQLKHQQIAVVTNEYGGNEGIITMEDILEELVGEIQDEYDNETPFVEKTGEKTYTVLASASIDDINEFLPHPIEKDEQYETLTGLITLKLERIPNMNDKITFQKYECTILKKVKNIVVLVQLREIEE